MNKFVLQDVAIAQIIDVMSKSVKEEPRTLFVVGAYHIGKERAFLGAAKALQWPVWVNPAKMRVSVVPVSCKIFLPNMCAHLHAMYSALAELVVSRKRAGHLPL